jgi:CRP/FNR family transcriptional regulator, cyclic AMP receptor protein
MLKSAIASGMMNSMTLIERFQGVAGRRALLEALTRNELICDKALAQLVANACTLLSFNAEAAIVTQGGADQELYFLLAGSVVIERNGRAGPIRSAGSYVGEMSVIDGSVKRSATVRAREETVVAKISEPAFAALADEHPILWRRLAMEVARRLRQRLEDVPQRNAVPRVFIGSSREALLVAAAIEAGLKGEGLEVVIWTEGVFGASVTNIEALEGAIRTCDFAVLILSADDKVTSRGRAIASPRDNVILELGMFIGAVGRSRTFAVLPEGANVKTPSDLLGLVPLFYSNGDPPDATRACREVRAAVLERGPK